MDPCAACSNANRLHVQSTYRLHIQCMRRVRPSALRSPLRPTRKRSKLQHSLLYTSGRIAAPLNTHRTQCEYDVHHSHLSRLLKRSPREIISVAFPSPSARAWVRFPCHANAMSCPMNSNGGLHAVRLTRRRIRASRGWMSFSGRCFPGRTLQLLRASSQT